MCISKSSYYYVNIQLCEVGTYLFYVGGFTLGISSLLGLFVEVCHATGYLARVFIASIQVCVRFN